MAESLIFFNDEWVTEASDEGWRQRSRDARGVIDEMRAAGVYLFAGGLDNHAAVFHVEPGDGTRGGAGRGCGPLLGGPDRGGLRLAAGGADLPEPVADPDPRCRPRWGGLRWRST